MTKKLVWLIVAFIILVLIAWWMYMAWFTPSTGTPGNDVKTDQEEQQDNDQTENNMETNNMSEENQSENDIEIKNDVEGSGEVAGVGDTVAVKYTGKLEDGTVFDSSEKHGGTPLEFTIGAQQMIPGFDQGVRGMKVGGTRTIVIPPTLAYGEAGVQAPDGTVVIPPNATIIFEVELVSVK